VNRWLLNTFATWELALIVVGGLAAVAVAGLVGIRRLLPAIGEGAYNELVSVGVGLLAAVYGIVLAFVIVALYDDYKDAEANVRAESIAVAQLVGDVGAFPQPVEAELVATLARYVEIVRNEEWDLMADGESSDRAGMTLVDFGRLLQGYEPTTASESAFYDEAVDKLNDVVSERQERLHRAESSLPTPFQVLLLAGAAILIVFLYFLGGPSPRAQTLVVAGLAVVIGFNLLLALVLDYPFAGDIAVSDEPFGDGLLATLPGNG
jgi:hypothetical protein